MSSLIDHYQDYYGDPKLSDWRDLGARYKTENVINLWTLAGGNRGTSGRGDRLR